MADKPFDAADELSKRGIPIPEAIDPFDLTDKNVTVELDERFEAKDQFDPNGKDPHSTGSKLDGGKPTLFKGFMNYFFNAAAAVAEISKFGARKYTWGGWKTVPNGRERYTDAELRHIGYEAGGELYDPETGMLHAAHGAWNANARLELLLQEHPLRDPNFKE